MSALDRGSFETHHSDQIHDCAYDYYGRRVATASADRTVRVFEQRAKATRESNAANESEEKTHGERGSGIYGEHVATLTAHDGAVFCARWAHPKFGTLIASASFDHSVMIHKEIEPNVFVVAYKTPIGTFDGSVNHVSWAPHEYGCIVACASSDGGVATFAYDQSRGTWVVEKIENAHAIGCTGVSWAPANQPGALVSAPNGKAHANATMRLVTSGCDNVCKVWRKEGGERWTREATLSAHVDWVRDVAWSENMGLPMNTIASCGQDGKVFIWTQSEPGGAWVSRELNDFKAPVWRVSWSAMGNILAVSDGNNTVSIWKESIDGVWNQITAAAE